MTLYCGYYNQDAKYVKSHKSTRVLNASKFASACQKYYSVIWKRTLIETEVEQGKLRSTIEV